MTWLFMILGILIFIIPLYFILKGLIQGMAIWLVTRTINFNEEDNWSDTDENKKKEDQDD